METGKRAYFQERRAGSVLDVGQRGDRDGGQQKRVGGRTDVLQQTVEVLQVAELRGTHNALRKPAATQAERQGFLGRAGPAHPGENAGAEKHRATFAVLQGRRERRGYVAVNDGDVFGVFGEPGFHVRADFDEQTQRRGRIAGEVVIDHLDGTDSEKRTWSWNR